MKTIFLLVAFFNGVVADCDKRLDPDGERWGHANIYQFERRDDCTAKAEELLSNGDDCRYIAPCEEVNRVHYIPTTAAKGKL